MLADRSYTQIVKRYFPIRSIFLGIPSFTMFPYHMHTTIAESESADASEYPIGSPQNNDKQSQRIF